MLLKMLLALLPLFFFNDSGGTGGDGDASDGDADESDGSQNKSGDNKSGDVGGQGGSSDKKLPTPSAEGSANKLIKDFARDRGISVTELLDKYSELEDAGKSELERLQNQVNDFKKKAEAAEARARDVAAESAFIEAATKANARSPRMLFRAFRDALEFDKAGKPNNIADVIAKVQQDEPDLFKASTGSADGGQKGEKIGDTPNISTLIRKTAGRG